MFEELLERIAGALDRAKIPYMVIGGQAVLVYGEPRLTKDIDVTLGADVGRLAEVVAMASNAGLSPLVDPETFVHETLVLPCEDPASRIRVDFIFSHSAYEAEAIERSRGVRIGSSIVRFASLEDLVVHKMIAGRPRDIEDVESLLLKNPAVDLTQVRHHLQGFTEALAQPLLRRFDRIVRRTEKP